MYSRVLGTGSALPKRIVTNEEFAAMLARDGIETSDVWIRTRTGVERRHFAGEAEGEPTSSLAVAAARRALEAANVETSEIDLIIVATTTPDMVFPSVACRVQAALGARGCAAFDVQAVCAGFIYALNAPRSRQGEARAGGLRRGHDPHGRLDGPLHLRALRRRRGRCRAQGLVRSRHSRRPHVR